MMILPLRLKDSDTYTLFVVLVDENVERLKAYDPAEVTLEKMGPEWSALRLKDVVLLYATPEEAKKIAAVQKPDEVVSMIRHLSRGWQFKPSVGDHDGRYQRPGRN